MISCNLVIKKWILIRRSALIKGTEMAKGKVKWFNEAKGYGFIEQDSGKDIFVHFSSIRSEDFCSLHEGEKVLFDIYDGQKVEMAKNVVRI